MRDRPFASRLLLILALFLVLIPIAGIIRGSDGHVVHAGVLPGAVVAADPIIGSTTTVAGVFPGLATTTTVKDAAGASISSTTSVATAAPSFSPQADPMPSTPDAAPKSSTPTTSSAKKATTKSTTATTAAAAAKSTPASTSATSAPKATTTVAPKSTPKPTSPPTTKAPAPTTTSPAPVAAPPANTYSKADVEAIIRSVWPADQADEAVRVATRESSLVPTVRNWCCFGLFQIYFEANKKTLSALGVTSAEQLYDPRVNAEAAYAIWQRSGWGPWQ